MAPQEEAGAGQSAEKRFWEGPYLTVQSLLKREKNLVAIKKRGR